ncbi:terminase large subunit domain-containing protein [Arsenophonus sp.]|uniref:terminase large subunit domain-containing protein n=1 Tax=Arsenophonus sp. TaxID=1872640 RepID=UPI003879EE5F
MKNENPFLRQRARQLALEGYSPSQIAHMLGQNVATVHSWKRRDQWNTQNATQAVKLSLEARLCQLIGKEHKDGKDFKEIDLLYRQMERQCRIEQYQQGGTESGRDKKNNRTPPEKNAFSDEQIASLLKHFHQHLFAYQKHWYQAGLTYPIRNILKSRQIGATWFFAREALMDALTTGRNQVFLSASKSQAHVFKDYIIKMAQEVDVALKGDPIVLANGATLYFLGTNARTAQSYHGNLYLDEYFWIPKFQELRKVASGMAMQKKWRQTYFSTPSSLTHSAYPFWSGKLFNRGRSKKDQVDIAISHSALANGRYCEDGHWRQIVTLDDAINGGCNLFDREGLKKRYSPDEYQNLLMCEFVDDIDSLFSFSLMQACQVDSWDVWADVSPLMSRPYGSQSVWIGYDPAKGSQHGDSAGSVVIAPPTTPGGKFRILEYFQWRGLDFRAQAAAIQQLTKRYQVDYIGLDATGIGHGVLQYVRDFFPQVNEFIYNPALKNALVLKAYDVISHPRWEYDAGAQDIPRAFMAISRATTASRNRPTYEADRSEDASHADLAWATMHALYHEPLTGDGQQHKTIIELF